MAGRLFPYESIQKHFPVCAKEKTQCLIHFQLDFCKKQTEMNKPEARVKESLPKIHWWIKQYCTGSLCKLTWVRGAQRHLVPLVNCFLCQAGLCRPMSNSILLGSHELYRMNWNEKRQIVNNNFETYTPGIIIFHNPVHHICVFINPAAAS